MLDPSVLVLKHNYEPLNVCDIRRAVRLILRGKAELLEAQEQLLHTPSRSFPFPSVIRIMYLIKRPQPVVKLSRREVFVRDNYTCQYCGVRTKDLTIDHILPRHKGGRHVWENLVSACRACNHRKGGKTLQEAGMNLVKLPSKPKATAYYLLRRYLPAYDEWLKFMPHWAVRDAALSPSPAP